PRHAALARRIGAWCRANTALWAERDADPERTGRSILRALGNDGWLAFLDHNASAEVAAEGDFRSVCLIRQALAYADDLAADAFSIQTLSTIPLRRHGSPAQQERYLPGLADGTLVASFAISEEEAGSDVAAIGMRAERVADGYILNGRKAWISHGS